MRWRLTRTIQANATTCHRICFRSLAARTLAPLILDVRRLPMSQPCASCCDLGSGVRVASSEELADLISRVRARFDSGVIGEVTPPDQRSSGDFGDLPSQGPWPHYVQHHFRCTVCRRLFLLAVDTGIGAGRTIQGEWRLFFPKERWHQQMARWDFRLELIFVGAVIVLFGLLALLSWWNEIGGT